MENCVSGSHTNMVPHQSGEETRWERHPGQQCLQSLSGCGFQSLFLILATDVGGSGERWKMEIDSRDDCVWRIQRELPKIGGGFPSSPVVETLNLHFRGMGSIPSQGMKIPHALECRRKKKYIYIYICVCVCVCVCVCICISTIGRKEKIEGR